METVKKVNWTANALLMVSEIYDYMEEKSSEYDANVYIEKLLEFGNNLAVKSTHFSFCRNTKLQEKGYRCALFQNNISLSTRKIRQK